MYTNKKRYELILGLKDRLDYAEFVSACTEHNVPIMSVMEYATKVGMMQVAHNLYPDLTEIHAYLKLMQEHAESPTIPAGGQSRGLGDTVAKITHATGLDKLASLYTSITGRPCGCAERQEALNKLVPYGISEKR